MTFLRSIPFIMTLFTLIVLLIGQATTQQRRIEELQAHVRACHQEVEGMVPLCDCGEHDCSIAASCTREETTRYEVQWNARHMTEHAQ